MKVDYAKIIKLLSEAKHIYIIGDGGSAALSEHFACDLLKNAHLPAISLCSNSAILTAIANDFSFDNVFLLQLQYLFQPEDLLVVFSTSGNSPNLVKAMTVVGKSIVVVGNKHSILGRLGSLSHNVIVVEGKDQMEKEDNMLKLCHEISRRLIAVI